jgi:hypothetical protein
VPLADGTLKLVMNIIAVANIGVVMNADIRSPLRFTPENRIFCELKQGARRECISVGRIIIMVNE